jgi:hypothetical protein
MAPGPMATAVTCLFCGLAGSAAAGIAEFQGGRAGIPVAGGSRNLLVLLTACAGMEGGGFFVVVGFLGIGGC